ncbi:GNAT family N-acetyltransferase [Tissierella sp. MSJ-40]|uniref:GNAT family N-acetyltransferase n=1 Tax=Tissierella simiarum TaxID=2841534 RepID=A0ABS6E305_9FIRM|nr:GNAT family N-acetyltransferase [Tissierella simiarum]MBU5437279.1 GNAT family N-acetyltransferase [Tissierella simiarum]
MIIYSKCTDVEFEKVYEAFRIGFSDYIIKVEISKDGFLNRFFGPEGNHLEHSFIALDQEKPIGLILGGIKNYEGVKTLRCGALCIHPDYRGKGVSKQLFDLHRQVAVDNNCRQMFLEVIVGNDRAIKFYRNLGYNKVYDIKYYSYKDISSLQGKIEDSIDIQKINFEDMVNLAVKLEDTHINWQNDLDYMKELKGLTHYGVYESSELIGALTMSANGKIFFIWTKLQCRHRGIARNLIINAVNDLKLKNLNISFPNNANIEGFINHIGFQRDEISQYEMYLTI